MSEDSQPFVHPKDDSSDKPPPVYYDRSNTPVMVGILQCAREYREEGKARELVILSRDYAFVVLQLYII